MGSDIFNQYFRKNNGVSLKSVRIKAKQNQMFKLFII